MQDVDPDHPTEKRFDSVDLNRADVDHTISLPFNSESDESESAPNAKLIGHDDSGSAEPDEGTAPAVEDGPPVKSQITVLGYPLPCLFIISNEFCERFSFYGLKAILAVYLNRYMLYSESRATAVLHIFIFAAYLFPLLGGWLADSFLGKFKTIFYLSIVYTVGSVFLSVTAVPGLTGTPPHAWGFAIGLLLIALGTGGIKPCVSAFGGDQIDSSRSHLLEKFFSAFYLSINLGSILSTFITPILERSFGFSTAFGVPAVLLFVSTLIFVAGRRTYRVTRPVGNVLGQVIRILFYGIRCLLSPRKRRQWRATVSRQTSHWLDMAKDRFPDSSVEDVKVVLRVLVIFAPLPIFWSLFDQNASRWVFQAQRLDRRVFGNIRIQASQITIFNPILVVVVTLLFQYFLYPFLRNRLHINLRPIRRMMIGMFITCTAFLSAALVQMAIQEDGVNSYISDCAMIKGCAFQETFSSSLCRCVNGTTSSLHEYAATCTPICEEAICGENGLKCPSVWLQLIQFLLLTCGEVLVSITGLEFAYAESPLQMKSVIMACFLLTIAIGNFIIFAIAESQLFSSLVVEMFFYAGLMLVFAFIFWFLARSYIPRIPHADDVGTSSRKPTKSGKKKNAGKSSGRVPDSEEIVIQMNDDSNVDDQNSEDIELKRLDHMDSSAPSSRS